MAKKWREGTSRVEGRKEDGGLIQTYIPCRMNRFVKVMRWIRKRAPWHGGQHKKIVTYFLNELFFLYFCVKNTCIAAWRAAAAATADELDEEDESWTFETEGPS